MRPAAKHSRRVAGLTILLAMTSPAVLDSAWAEPTQADLGRAEAAPDEPGRLIDALDDTLLSVMRDADKLGYSGRYKILEPAIDRTFNIPLMTAIVVGSPWTSWTEDQRGKITQAFRRFIIATYARRFDGYSGEKFEPDGTRPVFNGTLVMTKIIRPADEPVTLNYLTRLNTAGHSQVVDVFLTGTISELATRRSEFGAVLQRDGYAGLLAALEKKADSQATP